MSRLRPDAPQIHGQAPDNIAFEKIKDHGDPDKAFEECDQIFTDEFGTPVNHNCYAEFHVAVADFSNPKKLTLWSPLQGAPGFQESIGSAFGLSQSQIQLHYLNVGGAFTGRGRLKLFHFVAILLSRKTGRPVKIRAKGDEEFLVGNLAGGNMFRFRTGVTKEGKIKVIEADVVLDCGAHPETQTMLIMILDGALSRLYGVDAVRYHGRLVYTNNKPYFCHHGGPIGQMNAGWM